MRTLKRLLIVLLVLVAGGLGAVGYLVNGLIHPARVRLKLQPSDFMVSSEDVEFSAGDGLPLKGWLLGGRTGAPAVLLCHGLGVNRAALMNLALPLHRAGYHVLLFDFRGHGESGGSRSTLGVDEAQDVLGAIDFLATHKEIDSRRVGGWGKDIGAYALVLASRQRTQLKALALDELFPSTEFLLGERLFESTGPLQEPLAWIAAQEFRWGFRPRSTEPPVAAVLGTLSDRSLFLVVSREETRQEMMTRGLLASVPEGKDTEKNLLELNTSWSQNLYGEDKTRYEKEVRQFFLRALPLEASGREKGSLKVIEG
jgi:pimeloyl-ACP methyl ester carboxylesterase